MPASYRREVEYDRNRVSRVNPPVDDDLDGDDDDQASEAPEAPAPVDTIIEQIPAGLLRNLAIADACRYVLVDEDVQPLPGLNEYGKHRQIMFSQRPTALKHARRLGCNIIDLETATIFGPEDEAPAPVVTFKKLRKADNGFGDRGTVVRTSARYGVYRDGELVAVIVNANHSMGYRDEGMWQLLDPETLRLIPGTSAGASHLWIAKGVAEDVFGKGC